MKKFTICLLLIGLIFISACSEDTYWSDDVSIGREVKVGVILSTSGSLAPIGEMVKKGIELALEEVNLVGGVDNSYIRIIFVDDQSIPAQATKVAETFYKQGDIAVIIGGTSDECTLAIASFTSKIRMPLLSPAATGLGITGVGPYVFRNSLTDYNQAKAIAEYASMVRNLRTFAVIYPATTQGMNLNKVFTQRIQEIGGRVIANEMYDQASMDFSELLKKLKVLEPQAIYFPGEVNDILLITRQSEQVGLSTVFLGTNDWSRDEVVKLGGEYMEGAVYTAAFYKNAPDNLVKNFVARFKTKFKKDPDGWAAQGYDAARLVVQAMFAGGKDRQGIKNGLLTIKNFPGVTGLTSFRADGEAEKDPIILGISSKQVSRVE